MSTEVKLILQNGVKVNTSTGIFNLAGNYLEGKRDLFLSENYKFMINSLNVNIDTNDIANHMKIIQMTMKIIQKSHPICCKEK